MIKFIFSMQKLPKINEFAISLQNLKKEVSDEVDFLYVDKNESFLQVVMMIFDGDAEIELTNFK